MCSIMWQHHVAAIMWPQSPHPCCVCLFCCLTAGRSVQAGLTACDIVSKWTWAATLLQSSNVAYKYGVAGPFWYASGELSWAAATAAARICCCQDLRHLKVPTGRHPALLILQCLTTNIFVVGTVLHPGPAASIHYMLDVAISHLIGTGAVCVVHVRCHHSGAAVCHHGSGD
jgi:hypothetical protein